MQIDVQKSLEPVNEINLTIVKDADILTPEHLLACSGKRVCLDTETTGLKWWDDKLVGLAIWCPDADIRGYIHTETDAERAELKRAVQKLSSDTVPIAHNLKFDFHFLDLSPKKFDDIIDTTVLVHLLDSRFKKGAAAVEDLLFGTNTKGWYADQVEKKKRKKIWEWPKALQRDYATNDAKIEYLFAKSLVPVVDKMELYDLFIKDMKYLKVVWDTERHGQKIDVDTLMQSRKAMGENIDRIAKQLYDEVGYEFNWRSHKQLSKALYEDYGWQRPVNPFADADGVDRSRFADRGKYNSSLTSTLILTEKAKHPLAPLVTTIREASKMRSTIDQWLSLLDSDNVIHSNFNITGTRTGRLSSSKPNLQNVPSEFRGALAGTSFGGELVRSAEYNLRKTFVAREGYELLAIDYKQMEMRMFGLLAEEPIMLESLANGRDIHGDIAETVWGTRNPAQREWSKMISFGLIYGMTTGSLQFKLDMTRAQAQKVTSEYWQAFPRIKPWLHEVVMECKRYGFVRYWSGRIWREEDSSMMYRGANALIQGGCADLLSIAALRSDYYIQNTIPDKAHIWNYVHDEIIFEVQKGTKEKVTKPLEDIIQVPDVFDLPFFTSTKAGRSYGELEKVDDYEYDTFERGSEDVTDIKV
jgi:DNA polymerase-1